MCGGLVGLEVRQSRALGSCGPGAAAAHAGLAAVAVSVVVAFNAVVLIWKLAWMDFLTLRSLLWVVTGRRLSLTACRSGRSGCIRCRDVDAEVKLIQSDDSM